MNRSFFKTTIMKKQILALCMLTSLGSCRQLVIESVNTGEYYVTNNTTENILIQADSMNTPAKLQDSIVAPGNSVLIVKVAEMTGGHILPSNFFTDFRVFVRRSSGDSIIYRGVHNSDWQPTHLNIRNTRLTLNVE
jgi:hypothetical protein